MKDKDEGERMKGLPFILTPSLYILDSSTALPFSLAGEKQIVTNQSLRHGSR